MEYTLKEAITLLKYSKKWNADNDTVCIDLMDKFPGYIFTWDEDRMKFIGTFNEI